MSILAPLGLAALIGIPLIVLFHMRHFTPYERHVPTLRFWREAEPARTDDARFRRPPLTLLLLLQLLVAGSARVCPCSSSGFGCVGRNLATDGDAASGRHPRWFVEHGGNRYA